MKKTILLVDDEINILDIQNRYLIQAGYDVLVAHDGKEGLELFRKKSIDLIITDIMMPNMDGYDFISEVQYIAPNQPFLFTTAKTSDQDKIYGLSLGADALGTSSSGSPQLTLRSSMVTTSSLSLVQWVDMQQLTKKLFSSCLGQLQK